MLSPFMTWGDVRRMQRQGTNSMLATPFDYLYTPEMIEAAQHKHPDEYFFELSPEMIAEDRHKRWPRVPQAGESLYHEVVAHDRTILLLVLVVNEDQRYYRAEGDWIYIGPGDNVSVQARTSTYGVSPSFVELFDRVAAGNESLELPDALPYMHNLHEHYLTRGKLGYHSYAHLDDGAYLLVTPYSPPEQDSQTTLFLITATLWLRRFEGGWVEVDDDQIVGNEGEFCGAVISPLLEYEAITWWDSLTSAPSLAEALVYCAAFPIFRFETAIDGQVKNLLLETENGTWEIHDSGWQQRQGVRVLNLDKQRDIESFVAKSWQVTESRPDTGHSGATDCQRTSATESIILEGMRIGLFSLVNASLAEQAREWVLLSRAGTAPTTPAIAFLEAFTTAEFVINDGGAVALINNADGMTWERVSRAWRPVGDARKTELSQLPQRVKIAADRLRELTVWWDNRSSPHPASNLIPANHAVENDYCVALKEVFNSALDYEVVSVLDGEREWSKHRHGWAVEPIREPEEPYFDERLPDWFYNA